MKRKIKAIIAIIIGIMIAIAPFTINSIRNKQNVYLACNDIINGDTVRVDCPQIPIDNFDKLIAFAGMFIACMGLTFIKWSKDDIAPWAVIPAWLICLALIDDTFANIVISPFLLFFLMLCVLVYVLSSLTSAKSNQLSQLINICKIKIIVYLFALLLLICNKQLAVEELLEINTTARIFLFGVLLVALIINGLLIVKLAEKSKDTAKKRKTPSKKTSKR